MDLEEQKNDYDKQWTFCCSNSSREAVRFISQMSIAGSILIFSFIQLSVSDHDREVYISLISFVCGVIFPNPSLSKK